MAEVFLCSLGQLDTASKRALRKAGVVVVEVEDPTTCQFIRSTEVVSGEDMLWACLDALMVDSGNYGRDNRERLAKNLFSLVVNQRREDGGYVRPPKVPK